MTEGTKADFGSKYEINSNRAERFGYMLLAGLAVELIFAFVLDRPPIEKISTIFADVLIVVGVWGEIHFGRIARVAGDGAQAEANSRAIEAELALAKFRQPRRLTEEQCKRGRDLSGRRSRQCARREGVSERRRRRSLDALVLDAASWTKIGRNPRRRPGDAGVSARFRQCLCDDCRQGRDH
jgi:hypothetical protein